MSKGWIGCAVAVGVVLVVAMVIGAWVAGQYNMLVTQQEGVASAWAQVENVYQRRADLVPNLVETVRGAKDFEQETMVAVTEARSKVGQVSIDGAPTAAQMQQFQGAQDGLSSALSRLMVVVERYPELKATQNFRDLQAQLEGTENRIAVERRRYNEVAQVFNTTRRKFPTVFIANLMGFPEKPYFAAEAGAEQAPKVEF